MKIYKIIILTLALSLLHVISIYGADFKNETLNYTVTYKWGLIHKDAGTAEVSLRNQGDKYLLHLTGKTKPWADKFYQVRDTLDGIVLKQGFKPLRYTKAAHEDGKYDLDDIIYSYSGRVVGGDAHRTRVNKKGVKSYSEKKLTASGKTYDMLSVFFFIRTLDYASLHVGDSEEATVFSGKQTEKLALRYLGKDLIKMRDGKKVEAYHINFNFTREGRTKSSDDIDAWLSVDSSHVPLLIVGSLPIGQIKCYLN